MQFHSFKTFFFSLIVYLIRIILNAYLFVHLFVWLFQVLALYIAITGLSHAGKELSEMVAKVKKTIELKLEAK